MALKLLSDIQGCLEHRWRKKRVEMPSQIPLNHYAVMFIRFKTKAILKYHAIKSFDTHESQFTGKFVIFRIHSLKFSRNMMKPYFKTLDRVKKFKL